MVGFSAIAGFFLGVLAVLAAEVGLVVYVIRWLSQKSSQSAKFAAVSSTPNPLDSSQSLFSVSQKQGVLWVLEPEKVPEVPSSADQTRKREMVMVSPVRKVAKIKDRLLILTDADGSITKITLKGCQVEAVSATSLPTRKWAKRFPIKIESKATVLYHGSKVLYVYAETSWEKESWCKALRLSSSDDKERLLWFSKLNEDFRTYLKSLTEGHPSLKKPSVGSHGGLIEKANPLDPPSKVRQFLRKISKKASALTLDEKRIADKPRVHQDHASNAKGAVPTKIADTPAEDNPSVSSSASSASFPRPGSSNHVSEASEADASERSVFDEGTLCWNLLVSRLFFDAKNSIDIRTALKARIQRTLSNMRIPGYIGELTCTDLEPGNLPPYILAMRAVPTDMSDLWALEMDVEYSGGVALDIEARLEMRELDVYNGVVNSNTESSSEVTHDLLEDFRHLEEELRLSDVAGSMEKEAGDRKGDKLRSSGTGLPSATPASRWKSILNSVAKHVSQVPLVLTIKVASMKGTIQLHIKPPPSDQLWFGFTSMPDINFQVECSVKDHKVTSGRIPSFFINRFKASIRETLVLPNCESAYVSWMLAEKDDWIPVNAAPLMWLNREAPSDPPGSSDMPVPTQSSQQKPDQDQGSHKNAEGDKTTTSTLSRSSSESSEPSRGDLKTPLLRNEGTQSLIIPRKGDHPDQYLSPSRYVSLKEEQSIIEDEDGKGKKGGRRAKMFDLGKKMGEKLEEKRRHLEEKSRLIVEKMRRDMG